jgi:protein-tyrosine phosphatase family protein
MIHKFREVIPKVLYRGSAPSPQDVMELKNKFDIKKIVSLDKETGDKIDRACKILNIKHIKMYIDHTNKSLLHFLSQDLKKLFLDHGPTFLHCKMGQDRSGLASALIQCKYLGVNSDQAIEEAKSLGFGSDIPIKTTQLFENIIRSCKPSKDINNADIVSNERTYIGDNRDSFLDEAHQGSFAPFLDQTRQGPMDAVYTYTADQSPTRQNYPNNKALESVHDFSEVNAVPQIGVFDNDSGMPAGVGPSINMTGFIYD